MANFHVIAGPDETTAHPVIVRDIGAAELKEALAKGFDDFKAMPTHLAFIGLIYPVFGIVLAGLTFSNNALPLLFPLVSGFALLGPLAALGLVLMVIFGAWLATAQGLYEWLYGPMAPDSYTGFVKDVLTTSRGWTLIILGHLIGFVFAAVVFSISVISFPLLLERDVGAAVAVQTSVQTVLMNPRTMFFWALIIAAALMVGSAPLLVGLAVAMPVLGHASWHLYRKMIAPEAAPTPAE